MRVILILLLFGTTTQGFFYSEDYCSWPLIQDQDVTLSATSKLPGRGPEHAKFDSTISWTSGSSDFSQYLQIDLRSIKNITAIATKGRPSISEFIKEYTISFSTNLYDYSVYKENDGSNKLFTGNTESDAPFTNEFQTPIIAQYLRINPTRWHERISLRVELYGCDYAPSTISFNSSSLIYRNLTHYPIASRKDTIKFRFKTTSPDGTLIYSKGTQSDYFALQLLDNRLILNINLGGGQMTSITAGSLLDDNLWHDVIIDRYLNQLSFTVDRVEVKAVIKGDFYQLDLDKILYIGGVPFSDTGLVTGQNFTGCMENFYLNDTNVIDKLKNPPDNYYGDTEESFYKNNTFFNCPESSVVPVSFLETNVKNFIKLKGYEGIGTLNVTFEMRTWVDFGVVFYHKFTSRGFCKLYFEKSKFLIEVQQPDTSPRLVLDNFPNELFNEGLWHRVIFSITTNSIVLSVDERVVRTSRLIKIHTGGLYHFGGTPESSLDSSLIQIDTNAHSQLTKNALSTSTGIQAPTTSTLQSTTINYVGCLRQISIDGNFQNPQDFDKPTAAIVLDSCQMLDRCNPNPCEHGSVCRQTSQEFECICDENYTGATCHMPLYPLSCESYRQTGYGNIGDIKREVTIDIDGSGPLEPFPVTCQFYHDNTVETILHHHSETPVLVDGYEGNGAFNQEIEYDAGWGQIEVLLNRSLTCRQWLRHECRNSRLFNSPSLMESFSPSTWWVSRQNTPMDYWAGGLLGSMKCDCGILGQCEVPEKWCNCDSGLDTWLSDEGWLTDMTYLPVRAIRVGDTGTVSDDKQAKFTLGPLVCTGDALFSTPITFRLADATLQFPLDQYGTNILSTHSWDIYLEFKTTTQNAVLLHAKGPTDFLKLEIINGNLVKFQVEAGSGPLGVNVVVTGSLADDQWHSVQVEKNRKQLRIVLDGSQTSSILQPPGPQRNIYLTSDLYLGATIESRDGYVGCIRSLLVNGLMFDLKQAGELQPYGVGLGCFGKCGSGPCLNNGTCEEGYDKYTCDCRFTAFKGPICADEIGINLASNSYVKMEFRGSYKSTIAEKLRVGFTTTEPKGFLVGLSSNKTGEYLTLMVSNSGHLRLVFDFGFERQELIFPDQNFATGQYHDVQITRLDSGTKLIMKVDNLEPKIYHFDVKNSADAQFNNIEYLYIGKNESMREGFIGCISRVEFDDQYPLKYYFQEDRPSTIYSYPATLIEDFCSVEPVTHPPEIPESRPLPKLDEDKLRAIYNSSTIQSAILGGILALLFLLIILIVILIGRQVGLYKGQYLTQEDEGALGSDGADEAVVRGVAGVKVGVKREWFI
ncbi:neurexin-4 isoform X2 [Folsomia candida]|uniref:neurexin-4 isoform X2 n=1 Tax=Folsomia candida TaxID=158441 RepID=UPI000B909B5A|nr:neurexin-4 isoform X2 [Folsomia candida]